MFPSMLFEKVNFREVINTWRQLEDPDFPEVAFIERIGFGRKQESQISSKAHLNEVSVQTIFHSVMLRLCVS